MKGLNGMNAGTVQRSFTFASSGAWVQRGVAEIEPNLDLSIELAKCNFHTVLAPRMIPRG